MASISREEALRPFLNEMAAAILLRASRTLELKSARAMLYRIIKDKHQLPSFRITAADLVIVAAFLDEHPRFDRMGGEPPRWRVVS